MNIELKIVEKGMIPIYETETMEKMVSARELHRALENKRKFSDWIKQRIEHFKFLENQDFFTFHNFVKRGENNLGTKLTEYYITIDMAKELCMVENKEKTYYEIQYVRNTKNGKKGEVKERGYRVENVCYKVENFSSNCLVKNFGQ